MKRAIFLVLTLVLTLSVMPMAYAAEEVVASGECGDNLSWKLDSSGTLTISGTGDMSSYCDYGSFTSSAPWYSYRNSIQSVVIDDGVTSIGEGAFHSCTSLESITIPSSVTRIGVLAFRSCTSLERITIPDSVTRIGTDAFAACTSLKCITIPSSVTYIGIRAFAGCTSLESITILGSIACIDYCMFSDCISLKSIAIPSSVTRIDELAFFKCSALTDVYYAGSEFEWADIQIKNNNECLTNATIHFGSATHPHSYTGQVTAPTCTEQGYTTYTCRCGDSYVDDYVDATGHVYKNGICTGCGEEEPAYAPGDIDKDGDVDVDDVLTLLWHVLFPDEYPL